MSLIEYPEESTGHSALNLFILNLHKLEVLQYSLLVCDY
jgi:hypothetical protein